MNQFRELYYSDYFRMTKGHKKTFRSVKEILYYYTHFWSEHRIRFIYVLRWLQTKGKTPLGKLFSPFFIIWHRRLKTKYGLEINPKTTIGKGVYIGHPYNITISENAVIGSNVNIHKGATIGTHLRGKRAGSPVIGNKVWIGINAVIVGKVVIGDDVVVAPNSFVNIDVPSHSIALGNPCIIIPRDNATDKFMGVLL